VSANEEATLPDGTVIGYLEPWLANPGVFNGWVSDEPGVHSIAAEGVSRDRAELEIVRLFLVREIKVQEGADQSSPDGVERNRLIREGFSRQKALTSKILQEEGGTA